MRCVDVMGMRATPSDTAEDGALREHLSHCPRCAAWVEDAARFDRLWDATRPSPPPEPAWDALWARVAAQREASTPVLLPMVRESAPRRGQRVAAFVFGIAQIAAVLAAVMCLPPARPGRVEASTVAVEVETGQILFISTDGKGVQVRELARNENSMAVDPYYAMLNAVEGMATVQ